MYFVPIQTSGNQSFVFEVNNRSLSVSTDLGDFTCDDQSTQ